MEDLMDLIIDLILLCIIASLAWCQGKWLMSMEDRLDMLEEYLRKEERHEDSGH